MVGPSLKNTQYLLNSEKKLYIALSDKHPTPTFFGDGEVISFVGSQVG